MDFFIEYKISEGSSVASSRLKSFTWMILRWSSIVNWKCLEMSRPSSETKTTCSWNLRVFAMLGPTYGANSNPLWKYTTGILLLLMFFCSIQFPKYSLSRSCAQSSTFFWSKNHITKSVHNTKHNISWFLLWKKWLVNIGTTEKTDKKFLTFLTCPLPSSFFDELLFNTLHFIQSIGEVSKLNEFLTRQRLFFLILYGTLGH